MKFRKRPIVIEAYQTDKEMIIPTLEGPLRAAPGDWIISPDCVESNILASRISLKRHMSW